MLVCSVFIFVAVLSNVAPSPYYDYTTHFDYPVTPSYEYYYDDYDYYYGHSREYGDYCRGSTQCKDTMACINDVCGCTDTQYFDSTCKAKSNYGDQCSSSTHCKDTLTCINGLCGCTDTQFFDSTCNAKSNYGGQCSSSTQCKDTLTCINGVCGCTDTQFFDSTCNAKPDYTEECKPTISNVCSNTDNYCIPDKMGKHRCLCDDSSYSRSGDCHPLSEVRIINFQVEKVDPTQVRFTWTASDFGQQINYKIEWTSDHPSDKGKNTANTDGVLVSNLTPGRPYKFAIISVLSGDTYYADKFTKVERSVDMLPAPPGPIDQEASQLDSPPYNLTFQPSEGDVAKYKITLTVDGNSTFREVMEVVGPRVENLDLQPGRIYLYTIIAFNNRGEITEPVLGSFSIGLSMPTNDGDEKINVGLVVGAAGASLAFVLIIIVIIIIVVLMCKRRKADNNKSAKEDVETPQKDTNNIYMSYASNDYLQPYNTQDKENVYNHVYEEGYHNVSSDNMNEDQDNVVYHNEQKKLDNKNYENIILGQCPS